MKRDSALTRFQALAQIPSAGPSLSFSYPLICFAFLLIGDKTIGRIQLSRKLGLGEGAVRTILRRLSRAGLVRSTRRGCALSPKGLSLHKRLRASISETHVVDARQLALDSSSTAILVRRSAQRVRQGLEQRDVAVRAGATGACTMLAKRGGFVMPTISEEAWRLDLNDPLAEELVRVFNPQSDDVIIIASAKKKNIADCAVLAAGLTLVD